MSILLRQYEAVYWGESQGAQQHPELIKGRIYVVNVEELHHQLIITPINRVDLESDQIVFQGSLSIPQQVYVSDDDLTADWALLERPYHWAALREAEDI